MKTFRFDEKEHAYFLDEKPMPGVTTILSKTIPKNLTWWAAGMALEPLGWVNPKKTSKEEQMKCAIEALENLKKLEAEAYHKLIHSCYRRHDERKKERGLEGTDTHAKVEAYINYCIDEYGGYAQPTTDSEIKSFAEWSMAEGYQFVQPEKRVYSEIHWFAGTMDILAKKVNQDKDILDVKTSKEIYPEHFAQMGGYQIALEEMEPETKIRSRIVVKINDGKLETKESFDAERDKQFFLNCLGNYKLLQKFN